jgi:hypothetical protein
MGKIKFGMDGIPVFIDIEDIDFLQQRFREGIP